MTRGWMPKLKPDAWSLSQLRRDLVLIVWCASKQIVVIFRSSCGSGGWSWGRLSSLRCWCIWGIVRNVAYVALQFDPSVSATVYYVSSQYHKALKDFGEFYKSALMYLAYTSSESLPKDFKLVGNFKLWTSLGKTQWCFGWIIEQSYWPIFRLVSVSLFWQLLLLFQIAFHRMGCSLLLLCIQMFLCCEGIGSGYLSCSIVGWQCI